MDRWWERKFNVQGFAAHSQNVLVFRSPIGAALMESDMSCSPMTFKYVMCSRFVRAFNPSTRHHTASIPPLSVRLSFGLGRRMIRYMICPADRAGIMEDGRSLVILFFFCFLFLFFFFYIEPALCGERNL